MRPTYEDVARVLRYDAASGMLAWRTARRPIGMTNVFHQMAKMREFNRART